MLYNALIYPLLLYGITSWVLTYSSSLDALPVLQNKSVKIIHFCDQYDICSPHPLFVSSNILKVNELHRLQLASFVYESRLQQNPCKSHNYFSNISEIHSYCMQQGNSLINNYSSQVKIQLNMAYSQSVTLELLSETVFPRISSVHSFRKTLKKTFY